MLVIAETGLMIAIAKELTLPDVEVNLDLLIEKQNAANSRTIRNNTEGDSKNSPKI